MFDSMIFTCRQMVSQLFQGLCKEWILLLLLWTSVNKQLRHSSRFVETGFDNGHEFEVILFSASWIRIHQYY